jgi:hypothetical protein
MSGCEQPPEKVKSILPQRLSPRPPRLLLANPTRVARATSMESVKKQDILPGMIDEATDLLAASEGDAAVEECRLAAERNRRLMKGTD